MVICNDLLADKTDCGRLTYSFISLSSSFFEFYTSMLFIISDFVKSLFIIPCPRTSVGIHGRVSVSVTLEEHKVRELIMDCVTVPGDPQDVKVTPINSTAIHVEWKPPKATDQNGVIRGYHIHVQEVREEVSLRLLHDQ